MPITQNDIFKFVVREADVLRPSIPVSATRNFPDSNSIINSNQQISITENNEYVITFPTGLNTARYAYTEELDMIAFTSADVISHESTAQVTVYGEGSPRQYVGMQHNLAGTNPLYSPKWGVRMLCLVSGGGI